MSGKRRDLQLEHFWRATLAAQAKPCVGIKRQNHVSGLSGKTMCRD
jgi:hypothetical protein